jgi:hypothetical protein
MCCMLEGMIACLLMPCTCREWSRAMVHHTAGIALTTGPKQATAFCPSQHLQYDSYQGGLVWFCCLASEPELAHLGAVHPAKSLMA